MDTVIVSLALCSAKKKAKRKKIWQTHTLASERLQRTVEREEKNDLHIKMTVINMEVVNPFTEYYSPTSARNLATFRLRKEKIQFRWESIEIHRSIEQIQRIHNIKPIGIQPIHIKWLSIVIKTNGFLFPVRFTRAQFVKMFSAHRDLWKR